MPTLDTAQADSLLEPPVVEQPPPIEEDLAELSEEGAVPDVADLAPETAPDQASTVDLHSGVHYTDEYREECLRSDPGKWHDKYAAGHTHAHQFTQPYEGRHANEFALKKGQSASEGVQAFLKGLTVSDYRAIGVAKEINEVRDEMGDQKFDRLFGSKNGTEDGAIPHAQRLVISSAAYTTPIDDQMREIGKKDDLKQSQRGDKDDPNAWQAFEREPQQDAKAADKKSDADEIVQRSPIVEEKQDRTIE